MCGYVKAILKGNLNSWRLGHYCTPCSDGSSSFSKHKAVLRSLGDRNGLMSTFNRSYHILPHIKEILLCVLALSLLQFITTWNSTAQAQAKIIVGRVEKVCIHPGKIYYRAKMDTGAKTSSLGCNNISLFQKDGVQWVRFTTTNYKDQKATLEHRVHRLVKIKQEMGKTQERVVIKLSICLGNLYKEAEVNLTDRSGYNYQMLIGRSFMEGNIIVDPSLKYTTQPECLRRTDCD